MALEIAPALFLLGKAFLAVLRKARDLQPSLASAISPALLLSWQSPRHSSPRMLKQALMIQDFFLLSLPTSLFSLIPTYPLLSVQRPYLTTCGNKSQGRQHFGHSSATICAFLWARCGDSSYSFLCLCVWSVPQWWQDREEQTPMRWWNSFYQEKGREDMSMESLLINWIRLDNKLHAVCCSQQWYRIESSLWCDREDW